MDTRRAPAAPDRPRRRALLQLAGGLALAPALRPVYAAPTQVVRHGIASLQPGARALSYRAQVLRFLLDKSQPRYGEYRLQYQGEIPQTRALGDLNQGLLDVLPTMTSREREQRALPVRVCLFKGLMGLRVGLGLPGTVPDLERVYSVEDLRQIGLGLGFDWPDLAIQKAAGLQVYRISNFVSGVQRLRLGSFQLIPMGAAEAQPLAKQFGLRMVSEWAMAYPTAYYMFVSPLQPLLAERLQHGFELALADGSFDALFTREIEPLLKPVQIDRRRILRLPNPLLPEATPLARAELWHPALRQAAAASERGGAPPVHSP